MGQLAQGFSELVDEHIQRCAVHLTAFLPQALNGEQLPFCHGQVAHCALDRISGEAQRSGLGKTSQRVGQIAGHAGARRADCEHEEHNCKSHGHRQG